MDTKRVPFEELPITDRFMFAMVFSHKEIAKPFLEAVLGIKIHEIKEPEPEKTIDVSPVHKGVRFDVFVKETGPTIPRKYPNALATTRPCATVRR